MLGDRPPVTSSISGGSVAGRRSAEGQREGSRTVTSEATYRYDLDGLRGLAIALVVVFHIWFGRVSGGVDVFLVLSGFFFTGMLVRRAERAGSVGVLPVLRRTSMRLLPALMVVLAAVAAAVVLLRPYTQWSDLAEQVLASALYWQNWQLALSWSDYLAADPSVSPLQHLWSMAVQGQFYLVCLLMVGLAVWLCKRFGMTAAIRPALLTAVVVCGLASFAYAANGAATQQGWNYYDSFARLWELLAGSVLAIIAPLLAPPRPVRTVLAAAGLAAVLLCGWVFDGANLFPGPAALLPVGAAAALIVSGVNLPATQQPSVNRWLAAAPMRRLGDLSYSLYLWHWPILIFLVAESGSIGLIEGLLVIGLSMAAAWATHRWIEQPLRIRPRPESSVPPRHSVRLTRRAVTFVGATTVAVSIAWQCVVLSHPSEPIAALDPQLYPGAEALTGSAPPPDAPMRPTIFEAPSDVPAPTRDGCIADWDTREVVTCVYGRSEAARTLALVGSSHAEHWLPALQTLAEQHGFRIVAYLKMGCPLTVSAEPMYKGEPIPDCRDWSMDVLDRLADDRPEWVFTTGTRPVDEGGDETPQDYLDVWTELSDRDLKVAIVRDTPWLRRNGIRYRAIDCLSEGGDRIECGMKRADALSAVNPALEPSAAYPNVYPIDLSDAVCTLDTCAVVEGNILVYHDEHHLTASYSRSLAPELGRQLGPVLGWW